MKFIPAGLTSKVGQTLLQAQKVSPKAMFAAGIVGVVGTAVLASRATLKLDEVLTEHQDKVAEVNDFEHESYSEEDRTKDKAIVFVRTVVKVGRLYAPAVLVGGASIALLAGSNHILTKRNAALTAAYAAVEKGFRSYRDRVIEDLGEEKDQKYLRGVEDRKSVVTDETGKKKTVTNKVATADTTYGKLFGPSNPNWQRIPEYNYLFLRGIQNYMNDLLHSRGHVFLNEVYRELGMDHTKAGAVVGWVKGEGDDAIDFGIFENKDALRVHEYVTGVEQELYLDFNVDGVIYDKI